MAIFWNHIKGTGNATSNDTGLWTWIEWSKPEITAIPTILTSTLSPEIKVKIGNGSPDNDATKSLGNIITTNANVDYYGEWKNHEHAETSAYSKWSWSFDGQEKFSLEAGDDGPIFCATGYIHCEHNIREYDGSSILRLIKAEDGTKYDIVAWDLEQIQIDHPLYNKKLIHTDDKCEALYFNATSDKRAKENIQPATFSGLDLINKLSLYTFNYKNKTDIIPGILAQDLLEVQPEGLDLVDNVHARGKDNDYMSIKESKLIFVLMQAIKEQQAQIEELKAQIKNLTK